MRLQESMLFVPITWRANFCARKFISFVALEHEKMPNEVDVSAVAGAREARRRRGRAPRPTSPGAARRRRARAGWSAVPALRMCAPRRDRLTGWQLSRGRCVKVTASTDVIDVIYHRVGWICGISPTSWRSPARSISAAPPRSAMSRSRRSRPGSAGSRHEVGFPIVRRSQRYEGLTPEGERVLEWARRILADVGGLDAELGAMRGGLTGQLRLGAIPTSLPSVSLLTTPLCARHPASRSPSTRSTRGRSSAVCTSSSSSSASPTSTPSRSPACARSRSTRSTTCCSRTRTGRSRAGRGDLGGGGDAAALPADRRHAEPAHRGRDLPRGRAPSRGRRSRRTRSRPCSPTSATGRGRA